MTLQETAQRKSYRAKAAESEVSEMCNMISMLVMPFIVWRNPNTAAIASKNNRWTRRQLYLEAKGERAQHQVLQMAVRKR